MRSEVGGSVVYVHTTASASDLSGTAPCDHIVLRVEGLPAHVDQGRTQEDGEPPWALYGLVSPSAAKLHHQPPPFPQRSIVGSRARLSTQTERRRFLLPRTLLVKTITFSRSPSLETLPPPAISLLVNWAPAPIPPCHLSRNAPSHAHTHTRSAISSSPSLPSRPQVHVHAHAPKPPRPHVWACATMRCVSSLPKLRRGVARDDGATGIKEEGEEGIVTEAGDFDETYADVYWNARVETSSTKMHPRRPHPARTDKRMDGWLSAVRLILYPSLDLRYRAAEQNAMCPRESRPPPHWSWAPRVTHLLRDIHYMLHALVRVKTENALR
ncbi:hypothetical protein B0H12DRAFT_1229096 [Mycena haematopus]|nr:hypothetical protein B0H12DRAFT_1229096 [Mycena haematopus]